MARIAVLADIHGNLAALEAVAGEIRRRRIDRVINLGDHVSGPLWPAETVEWLMRRDWTQISGNCDRAVLHPASAGPSDRFAAQRLSPPQREWLGALPAVIRLEPDILAFHGTPDSDTTYLLETVDRGVVRDATEAELERRLGPAEGSLLLCGHSHRPGQRTLGPRLLVNPGSVGLPAYDSDDPEPHVMESGAPTARFAVVERDGDHWRAELLAVAYDYRPAAARAGVNGRPDWANALSTGCMERRAHDP